MSAKVTKDNVTLKQEEFCQGVISGLSLSDAYRKAYKTGKMKANSINVNASKLMADAKVALRFNSLKEEVNKAFVVDTSALLREASRIAFFDIRKTYHPDGRVKLPHELDDDTAHAIQGFSIDEYGRASYKANDKGVAQEKLFKVKGLYAVDNKQKGESIAEFLKSLPGSVLGVSKVTVDDSDN